VWIMAIAALIGALSGAGFFAGRATAPGNPDSSSAPQISSGSTGQTSQATSTPESSPPVSGTGTLLTHYPIDISAGYGINFGNTPARPENCDTILYVTDNLCYDGSRIGSNEKLSTLNAAVVSYQDCENATIYVSSVTILKVGTTLCITDGSLVSSATITAIGSNPAYLAFNFNVWEGPSYNG
jgi:hypothetical protein